MERNYFYSWTKCDYLKLTADQSTLRGTFQIIILVNELSALNTINVFFFLAEIKLTIYSIRPRGFKQTYDLYYCFSHVFSGGTPKTIIKRGLLVHKDCLNIPNCRAKILAIFRELIIIFRHSKIVTCLFQYFSRNPKICSVEP